jgi:dTDP-4-amino-4,6-dideoxygalactose transaminase
LILEKRINVTKVFLPPLAEYNQYLEIIWRNQWLTNRGELVLKLEEKLKKYLNVNNILVTNNGTIPIQIALKNVAKGGEVITTPFSFVATTSAIVWESCTPVFVDIDPDHLTIDENRIEEAINEKTTAILATHVFGNPCNVKIIEKVAKKYQIKVIYDAAHCFGVEYDNKSVFEYGDISTCSFHSTKLFHTGEGGAIFCKDSELMKELNYSHNFGYTETNDISGVGINAKISELQAAMGLSVLHYIDYIIAERKKIVDFYNQSLDFSKIKSVKIRENTKWNYSYYPVIFNSEKILLKVQEKLAEQNIVPRRYFYPSLNTINYIKSNRMSVSESISEKILCLPLYVGLEMKDLEKIVNLINRYSE